MASIYLLPEEILLEIFIYLDIKDLGRCAQVCIKFRKISLDEKVWPKKLNLNGKLVPSEFLGQAISHGLKYLCFCSAKLSGNMDLPKENKVKYLNLLGDCRYSDGFVVNPEELTELMSSFGSLEKLSLGFLSLRNPIFIDGILQNCQSLKVLDLNNCQDLSFESIEKIVTNCDQLTEVSFMDTQLCQEAISFICNHLTPNILKLSLVNLKVTSENIQNLVKRCNKLVELDLRFTDVGNEGVTAIIENLSQHLVKVVLPASVEIGKVFELGRSTPKLKYLSYVDEMDEEDIFGAELKRKFPHLTINQWWNLIAHPGLEVNQFWEIKCEESYQFPVRPDLDQHKREVDKWFEEISEMDEWDHIMGNLPPRP